MSDQRYQLNLNTITFEAYQLILTLDETFVGTEDYLGLAYFWNYAYRHYLRDCSIAQRRRAHMALLKAGLPLDGESLAHDKVLSRALRGEVIRHRV